MTLTGIDLCILPALFMLVLHVPFTRTGKPELTEDELTTLELLDDRMRDAQDELYLQHGVERYTPAEAQRVIDGRLAVSLEIHFSYEELRLTMLSLKAVMNEFPDVMDASVYGPNFLEYRVNTGHVLDLRERLAARLYGVN
jgi:hypothetical protein